MDIGSAFIDLMNYLISSLVSSFSSSIIPYMELVSFCIEVTRSEACEWVGSSSENKNVISNKFITKI